MFNAELKFDCEPYSGENLVEKLLDTARSACKEGSKMRIEIKVFEIESAQVPASAISQ